MRTNRVVRLVLAIALVFCAVYLWTHTGNGIRFLAFMGGTIFAASRI